MVPGLEIESSLSSEMSAVQLRRGYKAYYCCVDFGFASHPVRLKNHPEIQQRKTVYDHEAIQKIFRENGNKCPQTRKDLSGDLGALESLQLEQLIFALEVEKQQKSLSESAKVNRDLNEILEEIKNYLADIRNKNAALVKKASQALEKLLKGDHCEELSLDSISRLISFGLEIDYDMHKGYIEKVRIAQEKAKQELEAKRQKEIEEREMALAIAESEMEARKEKEKKARKREEDEDDSESSDRKSGKKVKKARVESEKDELEENKEGKEEKEGKEVKEIKEEPEGKIIGATSGKKTIKAGETYQHKGDLTLSSIPRNAIIIVKDGSLVVKGEVGENATIKVQEAVQSGAGGAKVFSSGGSSVFSFGRGNVMSFGNISCDGDLVVQQRGGSKGNNVFTFGRNMTVSNGAGSRSIVINGGGNACEVTIEGKVKRGVKITSAGSITCLDDISENCVIDNAEGDINCANVGENTKITAGDGKIRVVDLGRGASISSRDGDLHARSVGANASLITSDGHIEVDGHVSAGSFLKTSDGDIDVGGHVERGVHIKTGDGDIDVYSADEPELFKTSDGKVRVGGKLIKKSRW